MTDKNNLNEFRKQYEKIQASDDLKRKVDNIIKKDRRNFIGFNRANLLSIKKTSVINSYSRGTNQKQRL